MPTSDGSTFNRKNGRIMRRWRWGTPRPEMCLFLVLLLYVVLWALCPQEFIASDPWGYSKRAFAISQSLGFGSSDVLSHRLAVTVPVASLYSIFGVGIITTNLWPLCSALIVVITVWLALPDDRSKIVGAILCLTSVPLFKSSTALYPDLIAAAFMASSSLILFNRRALIHGGRTRLLAPMVAVMLLFLAFLAKESAYWVLPLWAVALFVDAKDKDRSVLLRRFHLPALGAGALLGIMYLVLCHAVWGDPLARFRSIQALTGHHLWSWNKAPLGALARRLTISPARLLLSQYGATVLLLALLGGVISPRSIRPWGYYAVFCLVFYWFGSTSFTRYEPLPLVDRMTLPMLPGLYVLAAFTTSRLSITSDRAGGINAFLPVLLVLGFAGMPFAQYVDSWRGKELPEARAMSILRTEVKGHPDREYLLVCSDNRSPDALSFYFEYRYQENLHAVFVENLTDELLRSEEKFVFVDKQRSAFLKSAYGNREYDEEIDSLGLTTVYKSGGVELLRSERPDPLRELMLQGKRTESGGE
jgi:hypothetical protein